MKTIGDSPMMRQYLGIKKKHPECVLLFRMGDFYESFYEDAKRISRILGIALTARQKKDDGAGIPLAGFPHHALDGYLAKLLDSGCRVAICEQMEDPSKARGLVRREVIEVVTPGTVMEGSNLDPKQTVLLGAACSRGGVSALALCDLSTGEIRSIRLDCSLLPLEIGRMAPREILVPEGAFEAGFPDCEVTEMEPWKFDPDHGRRMVENRFGKGAPEGFQIAECPALLGAMGALLSYIEETKRSGLSHLDFCGIYRREDCLVMDHETARSLGITHSIPGEEQAVLADIADRTVTPAGARLWREWLSAPPRNPETISFRHSAIAECIDKGLTEPLQALMRNCADLVRLAGRLGTLRATPRDLRAIWRTAVTLPEIAALLSTAENPLLSRAAELDTLRDLADTIDGTISPDPPARLSDGGVVRPGVNPELDQLRSVKAGGREWMTSMLDREKEATGIGRMSIGYNRVFGYYIEVSRSFLSQVPDSWIRRQTLVGAERFVTPELKDWEGRILRADHELSALEERIFTETRTEIAEHLHRVSAAGRTLAMLDVISSLAALAEERQWVRPGLCEEPRLRIVEGRHPVLEKLLPAGECVPNTIILEPGRRILLVTGPNMAGKSTCLRQAALTLVLAQAGSFVPAESMVFSPMESLYTRIGGADRLTRGQSTFLVEMAQAASILNGSTPYSLAVLDEVGRGTSTFDGLSLAWAMLEYLHDHREHRPLVLFATHYHELVALVSRLPEAANVNVLVRETESGVAFLYRIEDGATDRSYGIHVASMAGVPSGVIRRAARVLADLESGRHLSPLGSACEGQLALPFSNPAHPVLEEIRNLDPDTLTPRKAMELLYDLRNKL
jgi:DNA mismatch repair protein MutS